MATTQKSRKVLWRATEKLHWSARQPSMDQKRRVKVWWRTAYHRCPGPRPCYQWFQKTRGLQQSDTCRFCHTATESTNHLISGCKTLLADGHYTKRHNKVCAYIHHVICKDKNIPTKEIWSHDPAPTTADENTTIYYDKVIPTGRFIESKAVKPDIGVGPPKPLSPYHWCFSAKWFWH